MRALWDALPEAMRGAYAERSSGLIAPLCADVRAGDVISIKGSLGSNMAPIVRALDGLGGREAPGAGSDAQSDDRTDR